MWLNLLALFTLISGDQEERNAEIFQVLLISLNKMQYTYKNCKDQTIYRAPTKLYLDYVSTDIMFKSQYLTYIPVKFYYVDFKRFLNICAKNLQSWISLY